MSVSQSLHASKPLIDGATKIEHDISDSACAAGMWCHCNSHLLMVLQQAAYPMACTPGCPLLRGLCGTQWILSSLGDAQLDIPIKEKQTKWQEDAVLRSCRENNRKEQCRKGREGIVGGQEDERGGGARARRKWSRSGQEEEQGMREQGGEWWVGWETEGRA